MRSYADLILLVLIAVFSLVWTLWGIKLFFGVDNLLLSLLPHFPFGSDWGRGELGDFLGGGLTGATLLLLFYSLAVQTRQLSAQQADIFEAGVFRTFQALRPEVEGISVRIISKYLRVRRKNANHGGRDIQEIMLATGEKSFEEMLKKYQRGDRSVFLRFIQKLAVDGDFMATEDEIKSSSEKSLGEREFLDSLTRFYDIMELIDKSLRQICTDGEDDFTKAIRSTEIFVTFEKLQRDCSKVRGEII